MSAQANEYAMMEARRDTDLGRVEAVRERRPPKLLHGRAVCETDAKNLQRGFLASYGYSPGRFTSFARLVKGNETNVYFNEASVNQGQPQSF